MSGSGEGARRKPSLESPEVRAIGRGGGAALGGKGRSLAGEFTPSPTLARSPAMQPLNNQSLKGQCHMICELLVCHH